MERASDGWHESVDWFEFWVFCGPFLDHFWAIFGFPLETEEKEEKLIRLGFCVIGVSEGAKELINPGETRSVVEVEGSVVVVVEFCAAIVREVVKDVEGEVVAAMGDNGVKLSKLNPKVECEEVRAYNDGGSECGSAQNDDLSPVRVGSRKAERRLELVMDLVDALVEPFDVQPAVAPVFKPILANKEETHLPSHFPGGRPGTIVFEAQKVENGPPHDDHGDDHNDIVEKNVQNACHVVGH